MIDIGLKIRLGYGYTFYLQEEVLMDVKQLESQIGELKQQFFTQLDVAENEQELFLIEKKFFGRKSGHITGLLKYLPSLPTDQRKSWGEALNNLKSTLQAKLEERRQTTNFRTSRPVSFDYTLNPVQIARGHIHP